MSNKSTKLVVVLLLFLINTGIVASKSVNAQHAARYQGQIQQAVSRGYFPEAQQYLKERNYDKALDIYNSILKNDPSNLPAKVGRANIYSELYKLKAAEREFKQILAMDPSNSDAYNGLGMVYYRLTTSSNMDIRNQTGEYYRKAASAFKQAITYNPANDVAYSNLANIYIRQGRMDDATGYLQKALELNSSNSDANYLLGTLYFDNGNVDYAVDLYRKAISLDSKNSTAHYNLGKALVAQDRYGEAIEELQTSLYLYPNSAPVYEKLGEAYKAQGNETAAIESFKKSIALKPEDTLPYLQIADIYTTRGDGELALTHLKSAISTNPDFTEGKLKIADISLELGKTDQALSYYKEVLEDDPGSPEATKGLSKAYVQQVEKEIASGLIASPAKILSAEEALNRAISLNPNDMEMHYSLVKLENLANKLEPNVQDLNVLVNIQPQNTPDYMEKGYGLLKTNKYNEAASIFMQGFNQADATKNKMLVAETVYLYKDYDVAENMFKSVLSMEPGNKQAERGLNKIVQQREVANEHLRLGKDLFNKKQRISAIDQLKKASMQNPKLPDPYYWLGEAYTKTNNFEKAVSSYVQYLNLNPNISKKDEEKIRKSIAKLNKKL